MVEKTLSDTVKNPIAKNAMEPHNWLFEYDVKEAINNCLKAVGEGNLVSMLTMIKIKRIFKKHFGDLVE